MRKILAFGAFLLTVSLQSSVQSSILEHERLRVRNTFKTPEEVVAYYCARDASGFIWSGLLNSERTAFTLWSEPPQQDSFLIARKYDINVLSVQSKPGDRAEVEVRYELTAMGDAHGTRTPPPQPEYRVTFQLKRVNGLWKISSPDGGEILPVVLEAKFFASDTRQQ